MPAFVAIIRKSLRVISKAALSPIPLPGSLLLSVGLVLLYCFFLKVSLLHQGTSLSFHTALPAMIDLLSTRLSTIVILYHALLLSLAAVLLCLFSYLSPVVMLHSQVSLLTVRPSLFLTPDETGYIDGPTVLLGALGSCARSTNTELFVCTTPSIGPQYDLDVLPQYAPNLLSAPTATTPAFIAVSLSFSILFVLLCTMIAFRAKFGGKAAVLLENPFVQKATALIGLLGFMIGLTSFLVIRMWFEKAVQDFNNEVELQTDSAPAIIAEISNGFIMVWIGYALHAVPLVCMPFICRNNEEY